MQIPLVARTDLRRLLKSFAGTFSVQIATALAQLATITLIAHLFGPTGNGVYAVSLLLPMLLSTFVNMGTNSANVYYLGSQQYPAAVVARQSVELAAILSLLGLAVGAGAIHFAAETLFPGVASTLLWLALSAFPLVLLQTFAHSIFQGLKRFAHLNTVVLTQPVATLLAMWLLTHDADRALVHLVGSYLIGVMCSLVLSALLLRDVLREIPGADSRPYLRHALSYGWKAHLSNVFTFLQSRLDIYLVNWFLNPLSAGLYVIAVQLGEKLWMLSQAVSVVLLPRLAEITKDEAQRVNITTIVSRMVLLSTAAGALLVAAIGMPLLEMLFGEEYSASYVPLLLMLPGLVALSCARVIASDIAARGRPELNMYMAAVGVAISAIGNLVLVPLWGLNGAALVVTIAYCADLALKAVVYKFITKAPFHAMVYPTRADLRHVVDAVRRSQVRG